MILNLISQKNFITFNKVLAKKIGLEEALVLGQVCSLSNLFNDKEFYFTYAEIEEETCLTEYAVKKAVQHLIELKILSMTRKGCPCRNWYSINEDMILSFLESRNRSSSPYEIGGTSGSENEGTSPHEIGGTFKKEINKEIKETYNTNNVCADSFSENENEEVKNQSQDFNWGDLQEELWFFINDNNTEGRHRKILIKSKNKINFIQTDCRELVENLKNEKPIDIRQAFFNFLEVVCLDDRTWWKACGLSSFIKNYYRFTAENYQLADYLDSKKGENK